MPPSLQVGHCVRSIDRSALLLWWLITNENNNECELLKWAPLQRYSAEYVEPGKTLPERPLACSLSAPMERHPLETDQRTLNRTQ